LPDTLPYVYVALLDVLGYRERLEHDKQMATLAFKDDLSRAMSALSDVNEAEIGFSAISDTVILTSANRERLINFLKAIKNVQLAFLKEKLFIRGGVSYEKHFKSGQITYSHALARAYELEHIQAIHPRVIIDHNIIEMFRQNPEELQPLIDSKLICVANGTYFLNILDADNWVSIYEDSKTLYQETKINLLKKEAELAKHLWFQNYILSSCHAVPGHTAYIDSIKLLDI